MNIRKLSISLVVLLAISSFSLPAFADDEHEPDFDDFLECISDQYRRDTSLSSLVFTPNNSSYTSILRFTIQNLRLATNSTPKPLVIITPRSELQIPPVIYCAKENDIEIRTRSGGHDYEGLSYVSRNPFVVLDLINFSNITVDPVQKTAWVQSGATNGALYYRVAEKSPRLAFPAGVCTTIGIGGHFSGGGYGTLMRKYGLSADNVIDARIIDVNGRILDRKSMGEDLFWAIRGGGGASFGVILAWKIQLVDVPENVTVFSIDKTLEQNATQLVYKWQSVGHRLDKDLFLRVIITKVTPNQNGGRISVRATFNAVFLGGTDRLLQIMEQSFPELGLLRPNCTEMSWAQSTLFAAFFPIQPLELLLNRAQPPNIPYFKGKSDHVRTPISVNGLKGLWRMFYQREGDNALIIFNPYGGRMAEIPESSIPFPHRAGILYNIHYLMRWQEQEVQNSQNFINWTRRVYSYMSRYVTKSPRQAYSNYRDLDLGVNNDNGVTSYAQASIWGRRYFKNNFQRLVRVKTDVDPQNFFRNQQSIPPLLASN